jgi:hypothetical protein
MHDEKDIKIYKIKRTKNIYFLSQLVCFHMCGKNAFVSMVEMMNSCSVYSSHIPRLQLSIC